MTFPTNEGLGPGRPLKLTAPESDKRREEKAKFTATFVSNLGIGVAVTGGVGPLFAYLNGALTNAQAYQVAGATGVCFAVALALHIAARRYLGQEIP